MRPFAFFVRTCHKSNVLQGATISDKMKHAGMLWRKLTPAQKEKVYAEAAKVAETPHYRLNRVRAYLLARQPSWTSKQINDAWKAMSTEQKRRVNRWANRAHYRAQVLTGARKRMPFNGGSFVRYLNSRREDLKKAAPLSTNPQRIRMAAKEWRAMTAAQKKKFALPQQEATSPITNALPKRLVENMQQPKGRRKQTRPAKKQTKAKAAKKK